ncbi:MAG: hypothetical protein ACE5JS_18130 [Nitrospinota bacterium]
MAAHPTTPHTKADLKSNVYGLLHVLEDIYEEMKGLPLTGNSDVIRAQAHIEEAMMDLSAWLLRNEK